MRSIVQITMWHSPYLGNFMASELALARRTRSELGLATHLVLAEGSAGQPWLADLDAAGVSWSILPARKRSWRAHLEGVVREHEAALVHSHFTAADLQAAAVCHAAAIPCVWHVHTGFNGYPLRRRLTDVLKMRIVARRRVARVLVVSQWLAELTRRRGVPRRLIEVLPSAIVAERFAQLPDRAAARERFGLDAGAFVALCFGWWPEVKGVDVLLDAVQPLAQRRGDLQVLLVGEEQMRAFVAERLPQEPSWVVRSHFVSDSAWLFAATDVFVSASRHEGQSFAIGEALGCGLPVVMSDIAGTAGWGQAPNVSTFLSEDAGSLGARLEQVIDRPADARARAGAQSREWLLEHFGIEQWCAQQCALYRELL